MKEIEEEVKLAVTSVWPEVMRAVENCYDPLEPVFIPLDTLIPYRDTTIRTRIISELVIRLVQLGYQAHSRIKGKELGITLK